MLKNFACGRIILAVLLAFTTSLAQAETSYHQMKRKLKTAEATAIDALGDKPLVIGQSALVTIAVIAAVGLESLNSDDQSPTSPKKPPATAKK